jgi:hypothetical protein
MQLSALVREGKTAEELAALIAAAGAGGSEALAVIQTYNEVRFGQRPLSRAKYALLCKQLAALQKHAQTGT